MEEFHPLDLPGFLPSLKCLPCRKEPGTWFKSIEEGSENNEQAVNGYEVIK